MSPRQAAILYYLKGISGRGFVSGRELFTRFCLREAEGRALILENVTGYAVLYLCCEKFNDPRARAREVMLFMETVRYIDRLAEEGVISVFRSGNDKLLALQDRFDGIRVLGSKVILNSRGDYSPTPEFIVDKNGQPLYEGILFRGRQYEQIRSATSGTISIGDGITDYGNLWDSNTSFAPEGPDTAPAGVDRVPRKFRRGVPFPKRRKRPTLALWLLLLTSAVFNVLQWLNPDWGTLWPLPGPEPLKKEKPALPDTLSPGPPRPDSILHRGIDISRYNGDIAALLDSRDSLDFVICKATEGTGYRDPEFDRNTHILRAKGYKVGAYHFFRFGLSAQKQAGFFWKTIAEGGPPDLPPIVDVEQQSLDESVSSANADPDRELLAFLQEVERLSGRIPIVYTNRPFADGYLSDPLLSRYPLWLAQYTDGPSPRLPRLWKDTGYVIWQQRCDYLLHDITVDLDLFLGDLTGLLDP